MEEPYIYIGKTVLKYNLRHGDVFQNKPDVDKEVLDLIIPISKLKEAQRELKNPLSFYSLKIKKQK